MGTKTKIEWCDHTFNAWWGCVEVPLPSGSACDHCYAREWAKRWGVEWGHGKQRRMASESVWAQPRAWNAAARKEGKRARVFCASMGDIFEANADLDAARERLVSVIQSTGWLIWLLLTKRPATALEFVREHNGISSRVMVGVTVESQEAFGSRRRYIEDLSAEVPVFLSCEPLLSPIEFPDLWLAKHVAWLIAGGESSRNARPMNPDWARGLRDQATRAAVPFHFKQWGESGADLIRIGKKEAGRVLDGHTWDEMPTWFSEVPPPAVSE
jgi:protein gp37